MDSAASKQQPSWQWPDDLPNPATTGHSEPLQTGPEATDTTEPTERPSDRPRHGYLPRTCRICLEVVYPTTQPPSEHLPGFLQPRPHVTYESSDPGLGRLLRPCKCKGSSRYVHEGCLQQWRHADPALGRRNFWQCPTCGFQYRMERVTWARWISSTTTQIVFTLLVLFLTIFLLGFIADPIINLYIDPVDTIFGADIWEYNAILDESDLGERATWIEHFLKGLASLGVLSFIKALLALSPWHWFNPRSSGVISGGRNSGRSRVVSISWLVVLFGIGTFLWVSAVTTKFLTSIDLFPRPSTKVSVTGLEMRCRKLENALWTYLYLMMSKALTTKLILLIRPVAGIRKKNNDRLPEYPRHVLI